MEEQEIQSQVPSDDNIGKLYRDAKKKGLKWDENQFRSYLSESEENRGKMFRDLKSRGMKWDENQFLDYIGYPSLNLSTTEGRQQRIAQIDSDLPTYKRRSDTYKQLQQERKELQAIDDGSVLDAQAYSELRQIAAQNEYEEDETQPIEYDDMGNQVFRPKYTTKETRDIKRAKREANERLQRHAEALNGIARINGIKTSGFDNEGQLTESGIAIFDRTPTGQEDIANIDKAKQAATEGFKDDIARGKYGDDFKTYIGLNERYEALKQENERLAPNDPRRKRLDEEIKAFNKDIKRLQDNGTEDKFNKAFAEYLKHDSYYNDYVTLYDQHFNEMMQPWLNQKAIPLRKKEAEGIRVGTAEQINAKLREEKKKISDEAYSPTYEGLTFGKIDLSKPTERGVLTVAQDIQHDMERMINAASKGNLGQMAQGFGDKLTDIKTWTAGLGDLANNLVLKSVTDKVGEDGSGYDKLTDNEKLLYDSWVQYYLVSQLYSSDLSMAYSAGQTTAEMIPFILEMAVSGGIAGSMGKALGKWAEKKGIKIATRKATENIGKMGTRELGSRTFGELMKDAGWGLARSLGQGVVYAGTTGAGHVVSNTIDNMIGAPDFELKDGEIENKGVKGGDKAGRAFYKAFANQVIEGATEQFSEEFFTPIFRRMSGTILKGMQLEGRGFFGKAMKALGNSRFSDTPFSFVGGYIPETLEEYSGGAMRVLLGTSSWDDEFNRQNLAETAFGLLPAQVGFSMIGLGRVRGHNKRAAKARTLLNDYAPDLVQLYDRVLNQSNYAGADYLDRRLLELQKQMEQPRTQEEQKRAAAELNYILVAQEQLYMDEAAATMTDDRLRTSLEGMTRNLNKDNGDLIIADWTHDGKTEQVFLISTKDGKAVVNDGKKNHTVDMSEVKEQERYTLDELQANALQRVDETFADLTVAADAPTPVAGEVYVDIDGEPIVGDIRVDEVMDDGSVVFTDKQGRQGKVSRRQWRDMVQASRDALEEWQGQVEAWNTKAEEQANTTANSNNMEDHALLGYTQRLTERDLISLLGQERFEELQDMDDKELARVLANASPSERESIMIWKKAGNSDFYKDDIANRRQQVMADWKQSIGRLPYDNAGVTTAVHNGNIVIVEDNDGQQAAIVDMQGNKSMVQSSELSNMQDNTLDSVAAQATMQQQQDLTALEQAYNGTTFQEGQRYVIGKDDNGRPIQAVVTGVGNGMVQYATDFRTREDGTIYGIRETQETTEKAFRDMAEQQQQLDNEQAQGQQEAAQQRADMGELRNGQTVYFMDGDTMKHGTVNMPYTGTYQIITDDLKIKSFASMDEMKKAIQEAQDLNGVIIENAVREARQQRKIQLAEQSAMEQEYQRRLDEAKTPEERAQVIQEFIDQIKTDETVVFTADNMEEVLSKNGVKPETIAQIKAKYEELNKKKLLMRGFFVGSVRYLNANDITDIENARSTYVHERQHGITRNNVSLLRAIANNASRDELLAYVQSLSGSNAYDNLNTTNLADEFISMAMEVAYSTEDVEAALRQYGINNDALIQTIIQLDNEQRTSDSLAKARRGGRPNLHGRDDAEGGGRHDGQDSGREPEDVGEQRLRPANGSDEKSGRTASQEVKTPEQLLEAFIAKHGDNTDNKLNKTIESISGDIRNLEKKLATAEQELKDLPEAYNDKAKKAIDKKEKFIEKVRNDLEAARKALVPYTAMKEVWDSRVMANQTRLNEADQALQELDGNLNPTVEAEEVHKFDKEPANADEAAADSLVGFVKKEYRINEESLARHTGWTLEEAKRFRPATTPDGGMSIEKAGEALYAEYEAEGHEHGWFSDPMDATSHLISVMQDAGSYGELANYINQRRGNDEATQQMQAALDYNAQQLGYADAQDMHDKRMAEAQAKLEELKDEQGNLSEEALQQFKDFTQGLMIGQEETPANEAQFPSLESIDEMANEVGNDAEEIERMTYKQGESIKDYTDRNGILSAKWYMMQKYADQWDKLADIMNGLTVENARQVGRNVSAIIDNIAEGKALLELVRANSQSTLPFFDGVSDGKNQANSESIEGEGEYYQPTNEEAPFSVAGTRYSVTGLITNEQGEIDYDRVTNLAENITNDGAGVLRMGDNNARLGGLSRIPQVYQRASGIPATAAAIIARRYYERTGEQIPASTRLPEAQTFRATVREAVPVEDRSGSEASRQRGDVQGVRQGDRGDNNQGQPDQRGNGTPLGNLADTIKSDIEAWAKSQGYWYDEARLTDGFTEIEGGTESRVFVNADKTKARKLTSYPPAYGEYMQLLMENIGIFNATFPDAAYEVIGFGKDKNGNLAAVVEQPYIEGRQAKDRTEVVEAMRALGFRPFYDEVTFTNGRVFASDVNEKNMVIDTDGKPHVIDAVMSLRSDLYDNSDILYSVVTPQQDAAYMDAVNRGDMETAQRMVMEAAKAAMPNTKVVDENGNPLVVYHGRSEQFNTFERRKGVRFVMGLEDEVESEGFFFTPDKDFAEQYAANAERRRGGRRETIPAFLNIENPLDLAFTDNFAQLYEEVTGYEYQLGMDDITNLWEIMDIDGMADKIKDKGYDGVIFAEERAEDGTVTEYSYCVFDPNQIKSADPVTYDDQGNVIPLSERFNEGNDDIRYSFVGRSGAQRLDMADRAMTRLNNLHVAREMEEQGKDAKAVKMATGWERGKDGKWRYEIAEASMEDIVKRMREPILPKIAEIKRLKELARREYEKFEYLNNNIPARLDSRFTEEEKQTYREQRKERDKLLQSSHANKTDAEVIEGELRNDGVEMTLGEILPEGNELLKAYPQLADIKVRYYNRETLRDGSYGRYNDKTNTLFIAAGKERPVTEIYSALYHEIQHAIQDIEGFAQGGNPQMAAQAVKDMDNNAKVWEYKMMLDDVAQENPGHADSEQELLYDILFDHLLYENDGQAEYNAVRDGWIPEENLRKQAFKIYQGKIKGDTYEKAHKQWYDKLNEAGRTTYYEGTPFELYKRLAGETEARNVQTRLGFTEEQRRQLLAAETEDVAREDQLVMFAGDPVLYSVSQAANTPQERLRLYDAMNGEKYASNFVGRVTEGFYRSVVDGAIPLKRLQDVIAGRGKVTDAENAYLMEIARAARAKRLTDEAETKYYEPMMKAIAALTGRTSKKGYYKAMRDVELYVLAKSGLERNQWFWDEAKKSDPNAQLVDKSGLTALAAEFGEKDFTTFAQRLVADYEARHGQQKIDELWKCINAVSKNILDTELDGHLISQELHDDLLNRWKFYVPMRGFDEQVTSAFYAYQPSSATIRFENPFKKIKGRVSLADNPFVNLIRMTESAINLKGKNEVGLALLNLAASHDDNGLLRVGKAWEVKEVDPATGEVTWKAAYPKLSNVSQADIPAAIDAFQKSMMRQAKTGDARPSSRTAGGVRIHPTDIDQHVLKVKVGGQTVDLYLLGNPKAFQALNPTGKNKTGEKLSGLTRSLSGLMTTYNPVFMVRNSIRDFKTAAIITYTRDGAAGMFNMMGQWFGNMNALRKLIAGKSSGDATLDRYWQEFLEFGGETGFTRSLNMEKQREDFNKKMFNLTRDKSGQAMHKITHWYFDWMREYGNRYAEDITRFAVFCASRKQGRSAMQAAADAKNTTANFNKKGQSGFARVMSTNYAFFNAAIQGLNTSFHAFKDNPGRAATAAVSTMIFSMAIPYVNMCLLALFGDDDDWRQFENMTQFVSNTHAVWYIPGAGFLTMPYPQDFVPFTSLGNIIWRNATGFEKPLNGRSIFGNVMLQWFDTWADLLPVNAFEEGFGEIKDLDGVLRAIAPTWISPVADVVFNRNFMGSQIRRKHFTLNDQKDLAPYWAEYDRSKNWWAHDIARLIAGGDEYRAAAAWRNVDPRQLIHLVEGYGGGTVKLVSDIAVYFEEMAKGDKPTLNQAPFIKKFWIQPNPDKYEGNLNGKLYEMAKYQRELEQQIKDLQKEADKAREDGNDKAAEKREKKIKEIQSSMEYKILTDYDVNGMMKDWREERNDITNDGTLSEEGKQDKIVTLTYQKAAFLDGIWEEAFLGEEAPKRNWFSEFYYDKKGEQE